MDDLDFLGVFFICVLVLTVILYSLPISENFLENRVQVLEKLHSNNICFECGQLK